MHFETTNIFSVNFDIKDWMGNMENFKKSMLGQCVFCIVSYKERAQTS